jgi:hypothetical protein
MEIEESLLGRFADPFFEFIRVFLIHWEGRHQHPVFHHSRILFYELRLEGG